MATTDGLAQGGIVRGPVLWGRERGCKLRLPLPAAPRKMAHTRDERGRLVSWALYDDGRCVGMVGEPGPEVVIPLRLIGPPLDD